MKYQIDYSLSGDDKFPCLAKVMINNEIFFRCGETWEEARARMIEFIKQATVSGTPPAPEIIHF